MDQRTLVEPQLEAGSSFLFELQKTYPLRAAFWVSRPDASEPSLLVVAKGVTDENIDVAYGEVLRIAQQLDTPWFDVFRVTFADPRDPLVEEMLRMYERYSGQVPFRVSPVRTGASGEELLFCYSIPIVVTS